ncbi:FK506-binding protein [compost metagenome]
MIAAALTIGTLGGFMVMVLAPTNAASDQARLQQLMDDYNTQVEKQSADLSSKYYTTFNEFATKPAAFVAADVTELKSEDLKIGDGEEIKDGATNYSVYYIGWNPTGKVFQQSINSGKLDAPLAGGQFIEGMNKGVVGMKLGGIRELTIPAAQAYKEAGSGADIPPNTPLKFIVMAIPAVEQITPSKELMDLYAKKQQSQQY